MRPRAVVALIAATLAGISTGARAAELRYGLRVEGAAEYDSNPARQEQVEGSATPASITAAPALRLVSALDLALLTAGGHLYTVAVEAAGKRLLDPALQSEDLLVLDGHFTADLALTQRNRLALQLAHYEAFQRAATLPDARDFRSTSPTLRLEHRRDRTRFAGGGGWRWFAFKPERTLDFQAPTAFLAYRQAVAPPIEEPGAEWDWGLTASFEGRQFRSSRCLAGAPCPPPTPAARRRDRFFALAADLNRTGAALLGGGLALQLNDSNSYGESLARLAVHLRAVVLLPWQLSLAGRAELAATRYRDAVQVGRDPAGAFLSIEEEGRSTVRLELVRPLGRLLEAGLRYSFWTTALGTGTVRYQRHTALVFLAVTLGS
jgi:hypothetical protein